jgi:hypothetical protein
VYGIDLAPDEDRWRALVSTGKRSSFVIKNRSVISEPDIEVSGDEIGGRGSPVDKKVNCYSTIYFYAVHQIAVLVVLYVVPPSVEKILYVHPLEFIYWFLVLSTCLI